MEEEQIRPRIQRNITVEDEDSPEFKRKVQDENRVQQILEQAGQAGARIKVRLQKRGDVEPKLLKIIGVDEYDIERLANEYGGGSYRFMVINPGGTIGKQWKEEVSDFIKGAQEAGSGTSDVTKMIELSKVINPPQDNNLFLNMMRESSEKSDKMLALMMQMQAQQSNQLMQTLAVLIPSMGGNKDDTMAKIMPMIIERMLTQQQPANSSANMKDMVDMIVQLRQISNGESPKEDGMMEGILKMLPLIMGGLPALSGLGKQPDMQQAKVVQPQTIPTQPNIPIPGTQPESETEKMKMLIKPFANQFISAAESNADVVLVCDELEKILNGFQLDFMRKFLEKPDWFEQLKSVDNRVVQYQPWFEKLRNEFINGDTDPNPHSEN